MVSDFKYLFPVGYADILSNGAVEGMRNHTATKLAGHLFAKGIFGNEVWSMLKMWNTSKNRPPLDESELRRTFNSVKNLESKNKKKEIEVVQFLDTVDKAAAEYNRQYVRVSFSADLLKKLGSKNERRAGGWKTLGARWNSIFWENQSHQ
jgi:hypothetical protein